MRPILRAAAVLVLVAAIVPAALAACPLCKDAKSNSDYAGGTASLPNGFYYSIILMVSAPFLVVGGLAARIVLARRRRRRGAAGDPVFDTGPREVPPRARDLVADPPGSGV